ncbi:MAG TPA: hypothetical protein VH599_11825 [Ktedonobacterales bacterium]
MVPVAPPSWRLNAGPPVRWPGGRTSLVAPPSWRPTICLGERSL